MPYNLGDEITFESTGVRYRIIRVVSGSETLFEPPAGIPYIRKESYLELRAADGEIEFLLLEEEHLPYEGPNSNIKGYPPITFHRKREINAEIANARRGKTASEGHNSEG